MAHRTYSVPAQLMGHTVEARVYPNVVEVRYRDHLVQTMPRLRGEDEHRIDYRHVIGWLVRKPGAFARYRYREDLYPSVTFRRAYDALVRTRRADAPTAPWKTADRFPQRPPPFSSSYQGETRQTDLTHGQRPASDNYRAPLRSPASSFADPSPADLVVVNRQ